MDVKEIKRIPIDQIQLRPQVREHFDEAGIADLAASIKAVGQLQPILARLDGDGGYVVVDGERRLRAAKLAGLATIDAIVDAQTNSTVQITQRQLIANCQRADLTAREKSVAIDRLMREADCTAKEVAKMLGFSNATVSRLLSVLTLPDSIQQKIEAGLIAPSAAAELARVTDPAEREELGTELAAGRLTRDALSGRIKAAKRKDSGNGASLGRARFTLGGERTLTAAGPNLSTETFIELIEEVLERARKGRTRGLELPTLVKVINDESKKQSE